MDLVSFMCYIKPTHLNYLRYEVGKKNIVSPEDFRKTRPPRIPRTTKSHDVPYSPVQKITKTNTFDLVDICDFVHYGFMVWELDLLLFGSTLW